MTTHASPAVRRVVVANAFSVNMLTQQEATLNAAQFALEQEQLKDFYKSLLARLGSQTLIEGIEESMPRRDANVELLYAFAYVGALRSIIEEEAWIRRVRIKLPGRSTSLMTRLKWHTVERVFGSHLAQDIERRACREAWRWVREYLGVAGRPDAEADNPEAREKAERVQLLLWLEPWLRSRKQKKEKGGGV